MSEPTTITIPLDLTNMAHRCFPLFLDQAEGYWEQLQLQKRFAKKAVAKYCAMVCGMIDAVYSREPFEQVRAHLTQKMQNVSTADSSFEEALEQLISARESLRTALQQKRPALEAPFVAFLGALTAVCLAAELDQMTIDRIRTELTPIEQVCAACGYDEEEKEQP